MTRKIILVLGVIIMIILFVGVIIRNSAQGLVDDNSADAIMVREVIQKAWRIQLDAQYTFDTSQYDQVYVNDPRGGEISDESLSLIREIRHDPTIQKNQVGMLDAMKSAIENLKSLYENYMADLNARQASGMLTEEEQTILVGETYGWPTSTPVLVNPAEIATETCILFKTQVAYKREISTSLPDRENEFMGYSTAYPGPSTPSPVPATSTPIYGTAYPGPGRVSAEPQVVKCPTATPTQPLLRPKYRGVNPDTLPPEDLNMQILSVEINDDIAKAIVYKWSITTEVTLIKENGQWYIAGSKLLKSDF